MDPAQTAKDATVGGGSPENQSRSRNFRHKQPSTKRRGAAVQQTTKQSARAGERRRKPSKMPRIKLHDNEEVCVERAARQPSKVGGGW